MENTQGTQALEFVVVELRFSAEAPFSAPLAKVRVQLAGERPLINNAYFDIDLDIGLSGAAALPPTPQTAADAALQMARALVAAPAATLLLEVAAENQRKRSQERERALIQDLTGALGSPS